MADRCGGCCREENMDCVADGLKTKSVYVYKVAKGFTAGKGETDLERLTRGY